MQDSFGPLYEVTLDIAGKSADEVDAWLDQHVQQMLDIPGFVDAATWRVDENLDGNVRRVTHYLLESRQAFDDYLAGPAAAMRAATAARFGEDVTSTRRLLEGKLPGESFALRREPCRNCGTPLGGQYCSRCGQRARGRLISLWELVQDAFGDVFELDSRLWQTLIPLLCRPGRLTHDYLQGRRARFMPPFRTYLVLSVVFFLVAFFDPHQKLGILFAPAEQPAASAPAQDPASAAEIRRQVLDDLAAEGIIVDDATRDRLDSPAHETADAAREAADDDESGTNIRITADGDAIANCKLDDLKLDGLPDWLSRRLTRDRLQAICEKISADSGREFISRLLDNVPAALFVLLPLMAFVLKTLYPLSKRYYVEHLLFVLHFHAFFFLILTLEVLWSRLAMLVHLPKIADDLTVLVISIYIPVYLYKAMRRVYEQGRTITLLKYVLLVFAYLVGFSFMLLITTFYTAFSI